MVDTTGTTTFGYDDLYRLTDVTYPNSDTQTYTYDAIGNRSTKVNNGATTTYTYTYADAIANPDPYCHTGESKSVGEWSRL